MAGELGGTTGFWSFLGQVITVVGGWVVVHRLSTARDRDKARREIVAKSADSLSDQVGEILLDAGKYHQNPRDVGLEVKLKLALQDLSFTTSALNLICDRTADLTACRCAVVSLRQSVTKEHFEDEHAAPLAHSAQQLQVIAAEAMRLKQALLRLKHSQFTES